MYMSFLTTFGGGAGVEGMLSRPLCVGVDNINDIIPLIPLLSSRMIGLPTHCFFYPPCLHYTGRKEFRGTLFPAHYKGNDVINSTHPLYVLYAYACDIGRTTSKQLAMSLCTTANKWGGALNMTLSITSFSSSFVSSFVHFLLSPTSLKAAHC